MRKRIVALTLIVIAMVAVIFAVSAGTSASAETTPVVPIERSAPVTITPVRVAPPANAVARGLQVPSVVGVSGKTAVGVLEKAHYKVYVGKPVYSSKVKKYCVVSQTPAAGTILRHGRTVTIYTSLGPKPTHKSHSWRNSKASTYGGGHESQHVAWSKVHGKTGSFSSSSPYYFYFAHKTMKFGTKVHFKYKGHEAIGICVDRGPYCGGRVFDLGHNLARALHFSGVGTVTWDYE